MAQTRSSDSSFLGLGIGVATQQQAYAGAGLKTTPFPLITYEGQYLRLAGDTADLKLATVGQWTFAARGRFALLDGYKAKDAPILTGMEDRKGSVWLGGVVTWDASFARMSAEVLADATSKSKGMQAKFSVEKDFRADSFTFTPRIAVRYMDAKYVDYYYGVRASEATFFRSAYEGKADINLQAGLRTMYTFNARHSMFFDVNATALGSKIKDSPLVDRRLVPGAAIGYMYVY